VSAQEVGKVATVCLVTSGNLASNPRLVKEAAVLSAAGYKVRIVAANIIESLAIFDAETVGEVAPHVITVPWRRRYPIRLLRSLKRATAQLLARIFNNVPLWIAARAHHVLTPAMTAATRRVRADLYLAHNLAALPAAAAAAVKYKAKLGFDAEDYHTGELEGIPANKLELRIRRSIERKLLAKCTHLTGASPQIVEAYSRDYGVEMTPILNVFSLKEAPTNPLPPHSWSGELPSLYWFSQTIGSNRGLEQIIDAIARMETKVRLVLRGNPAYGYVEKLRKHAASAGGQNLASRIEFLPVARPVEMVKLAAAHDLGLSVEVPHTRNRDICLTNKAFTYLLAGVPVLLSETTAQTEVARSLGQAALLVNIFDQDQVSKVLDAYFADRELQVCARQEAWRLGREQYNWEVEQEKFLAVANNLKKSHGRQGGYVTKRV
jgi:glycosyltransferase involved in cell wall biosynthesis